MMYVACCVLDQAIGYISIQGDITLVSAEARFYKTYDEAQQACLDNHNDWFVSEVEDPLFFITESDECKCSMPSNEKLKYATESDKKDCIVDVDENILREYGF